MKFWVAQSMMIQELFVLLYSKVTSRSARRAVAPLRAVCITFPHNPKVGQVGLGNCPCLNQGNTLFVFVIRQKEQMKKLNKSKCVDERLLFHGTNPSHLPAICEQNFDWRICGTHGTVYGKGTRAWAGPALKLSGCF